MTSSAFETILDDCLARVQAGEPLEYCLEDYPQFARELRPLLGVAQSVQTLPPPPMNQVQIDAGMSLMLSRVEARQATKMASPAAPSFWQLVRGLCDSFFKPALAGGLAAMAIALLGIWLYSLRSGIGTQLSDPDPVSPAAIAVATDSPESTALPAQPAEAPQVAALPPPQIFLGPSALPDTDLSEAVVETAPSELPAPEAGQSSPGVPVPTTAAGPLAGAPETSPERGSDPAAAAPINCTNSYFFSPAPESCPRFPAQVSNGAFQAFQHGWMVWLPNGDLGGNDLIYVLYETGLYDVFIDTWITGEPISDESVVAPAGLSQPIRGFGKVWRTQPGVAESLGWAIEGEIGYELVWQDEAPTDFEARRYIQMGDTTLIQLSHSLQSGIWQLQE